MKNPEVENIAGKAEIARRAERVGQWKIPKLKTLQEKQKLLITNNFSFSLNVFKGSLLLMC